MQRTWTVEAEEFEVRAQAEGSRPTIRGYAAVFNSLSQPLGKYRERIAPGAFSGAILAGADVRALWNHESGKPLGRTTNGTLRITEDHRGLAVEIDPPDTSWGRDAVEAIRRGDVSGMSFAFQVAPGGEELVQDQSGGKVRVLRKVDLFEVSPVTFPAYPATDVGVRCVAAGDMPDDDDEPGQAPAPIAPDPILRAQDERERRLRLLTI